MARKLTRSVAENRLSRTLNALGQPTLLIIDEVGYLSLEPAEASLLFQVIAAGTTRTNPPYSRATNLLANGHRSLPATL